LTDVVRSLATTGQGGGSLRRLKAASHGLGEPRLIFRTFMAAIFSGSLDGFSTILVIIVQLM